MIIKKVMTFFVIHIAKEIKIAQSPVPMTHYSVFFFLSWNIPTKL
jgi:hypothetical protein